MADLRGAATEADRRAEEEAAQARDRRSRGVSGVPARALLLQRLVARGLPPRARAFRARDRARPDLRAGLRRPRRHHRLDVVLRLDPAAATDSRARRRRPRKRSRSIPSSPTRMERWRSAACSIAGTGRTRNGSSGSRSRSTRSSPACARSSPSSSPRSDATTSRSPQARTGRELDPLSPLVNMSVGWALYFAGRFEEAIAELRTSTRSAPRAERRRAAQRDDGVLRAAGADSRRRRTPRRATRASACRSTARRCSRPGGPAARRRTGRSAWPRSIGASPTALPMIHYNYACVLARLGRLDEADGAPHRARRAAAGQRRVPRRRARARALRAQPGFDALLTRIGVPRPPMASAPRTAST